MEIEVGEKVLCWAGYGEALGDHYYLVDISMVDAKLEEDVFTGPDGNLWDGESK